MFFFNAAKFVQTVFPRSQIVLQQDIGNNDGAGAQLQRIASIYSLAMALRFDFSPQKIGSVEVQHGDPFLSELDVKNFVTSFNKLAAPLATKILVDSPKVVKMDSRPSRFFAGIFLQALLSSLMNRPTVVQLVDAYGFTNFHPDLYRVFTQKMNSIETASLEKEQKDLLDIQIHIRSSTLSYGSERYLDPEAIFSCLANVINNKSLCEFEFTVGIHTDCWTELADSELISNHVSPETFEYWKLLGIVDVQGKVNRDQINIGRELIERIKSTYPKVIVYPQQSPIDAWRIMAGADVLIISKSSFSFVGGLLNPNAEIWTPTFWISPLDSWKIY
jgi:hypothetical protein